MPANVASPAIRSANAALQSRLPFDDTADFEDAARGLLGRLEPCIVRADDGLVVWDNDAYKFLEGHP